MRFFLPSPNFPRLQKRPFLDLRNRNELGYDWHQGSPGAFHEQRVKKSLLRLLAQAEPASVCPTERTWSIAVSNIGREYRCRFYFTPEGA